MLQIVLKSFKDLFDKKIFFTSLIPIVIAALFWGVVSYMFLQPISHFIAYLVSFIPFIGNSSWLQNSIEAIGGLLVYYELVVISSVVIVGIIADKIVDRVNDKYYHNAKRGFGSVAGSVMIALKQNLIFIVLFILFLPLLFVPVLNIFVHLLLWAILIKKPNFYDSIAMYATKEEFKKLQRSDKVKTNTLTLLSASLFLIPIVGVFVYVVQLLMFAHFNLGRLKMLRGRGD
ncbi:MAG TPA: hypothetical protein ENK87_00090 [Nitratifractor sp.]|nr:hypothetical protein [Nitratifractor sp.]